MTLHLAEADKDFLKQQDKFLQAEIGMIELRQATLDQPGSTCILDVGEVGASSSK